MSKRILIVEDQEDLRGVLCDLLGGSSYAVIEAADGQAGVAEAKSERPDLILMDIQLPVLGRRIDHRLLTATIFSRVMSAILDGHPLVDAMAAGYESDLHQLWPQFVQASPRPQ